MIHTPANGTQGILLRVATDHWVFRVYTTAGEFIDYDLLHTDLCVRIEDSDATFYTTEHHTYLDHNQDVLQT